MKQAFSVDRWYEHIKQCTFQTEFLSLSTEQVSWLFPVSVSILVIVPGGHYPCCQVEALLAAYHPDNSAISDEQKEVLSALEERLNEAIAKFGEDGVFLKLNTQGVKDAILDQSDPDHITAIQVCLFMTSKDMHSHLPCCFPPILRRRTS